MNELKDVFAISDKRDGEEHNHWTRIGVAFVNKDMSLNVVLDAIPVNGRLHIRDRQIRTASSGKNTNPTNRDFYRERRNT
jgi:hypothetical protein